MQKEKLSEIVADKIKQDIKDKKFNVGDKIPAEPELMKLYNVGRSSIREAIKSLAMTGVLQVRQGDGTYVNQMAAQLPIEQRLRNSNFDDINAVRILLEEEIVQLATEKHTADDLKAIAEQLAKRKEAIESEDVKACTDADIAFHMAIAHASGNTVLAGLYEYFTQTIRAFFSQREKHGITHFAMSHHLHQDLYLAIRSKKKKQASDIIKNILNNNY